MKELAAAMMVVAAVTAWAPTRRTVDYPPAISGRNVRSDRQDTTPNSEDQSDAATVLWLDHTTALIIGGILVLVVIVALVAVSRGRQGRR
jgi:hypothetical protein